MSLETFGSESVNEHFENIDYSSRIDEIIERFPDELQQRLEKTLEEEHADKSEKEQYLFLLDQLSRRSEVKKGINQYESPQFAEVLNIVPKAIEASIERSRERVDESILGAGQTAEVLSSMRKPQVCYKVFYEDPQQIGQNTLAREIDMQIIVNDLQESLGVKIPEVYSFIRNEFGDAIMMEKVDGYSLREHMAGIPLPQDFDIEHFKEKILTAVKALNGQGIFHRDLTPGNIMIGKDGSPWIIDFGRSRKSYKGDEEAYIEYDPFDKQNKFKLPEDMNFVSQTLREFETSINT